MNNRVHYIIVRRHHQSRTRGFCWSKILLPACPCWRQLAYWD